MNEFGFLRVGAAVPTIKIADVNANVQHIKELAERAHADKVQLLAFPELCITGYTCADLFMQSRLLKDAMSGLNELAEFSKHLPGMAMAVGAPVMHRNALYNCAAVICNGRIEAIIPKTYLPNYSEFYEKRWFASATTIAPCEYLENGMIPFGTDILIDVEGVKVGIEICEDMWTPLPPSTPAALSGATVIVNLSASNELAAKHDYLMSLIRSRSATLRTAYVYASAGAGESSTDLVYSGNAIVAENGTLLAESPRFTAGELYEFADVDIEALLHDKMQSNSFTDNAVGGITLPDYRIVDTHIETSGQPSDLKRKIIADPFVPADLDKRRERCCEIVNIQAEALMQRLRATGMKSVTVGVSGGLDSTLAILVADLAFQRLELPAENIIGVTMPGFGTTDRTYDNAVSLIRLIGATFKEVSIKDAVIQHFKDINHDIYNHNLTYENSQARERTQLLMDISGQTGGLVLGTGDLSELALGWCTYNADQMSMYGVNASVPKTLVRHLVAWFADDTTNRKLRDVLLDIIDTPVSPELIPANDKGEIVQKTEDLVGPYELHDFFIYQTLRYGSSPAKVYFLARHAFAGKYNNETIKHWLNTFYRRFFTQQFKRSCMPDGPKVGSICLSPRGDWRMPSDASAVAWLRDFENV
ncbi:MAG: NAD(+) synthase [Muribaculaceae bacterium]|nr:NAD(+) synthase [Muribaculaceae bacterium]